MKLLKIAAGRADSAKCTLYFEEDRVLESYVKLAADFSLHAGCQLDEEEFAALERETAKERTKFRAAAMLAAAQCSEKDLLRKLIAKGESEENAQAATARLKELSLLDDAQFAQTIARRCAARGYGKARVKQELSKHGIDRMYWDEALEVYPDDTEKIDALVRNRMQKSENRKDTKKTADFLYRKGFSWEEISAALRRYAEEDIYLEDE